MPGMPDLQLIVLKAQQMQADMERAQADLARTEITGTAGGGLVTAIVSGDGELKSLTIDPSVVDPADIETLADLVVAAVRDATRTAAEMSNASAGAVPAGLSGLGGLGGLGALGLGGLGDLGALSGLAEAFSGLGLPGFGGSHAGGDDDDDEDDDEDDDDGYDEEDEDDEDGDDEDDSPKSLTAGVEADKVIEAVPDRALHDDPPGGSAPTTKA